MTIQPAQWDTSTRLALKRIGAEMDAAVAEHAARFESREGFRLGRESFEAWRLRMAAQLHDDLDPLRHEAMRVMALATPVHVIDAAALGGTTE